MHDHVFSLTNLTKRKVFKQISYHTTQDGRIPLLSIFQAILRFPWHRDLSMDSYRTHQNKTKMKNTINGFRGFYKKQKQMKNKNKLQPDGC